MQRLTTNRGFTLIELMVVISIMMLLAGLLISVGAYVQDKGKRSRAHGEIAAFEAALESYKIDNGGYPTADLSNVTASFPNPVNPPATFDQTYISGATVLYECLSGKLASNVLSTDGNKSYMEFSPNQVDPKMHNFAIDPWRNPYGYSYQQSTNANGDYYDGPTAVKSHNTNFADLWSTAGVDRSTGAPNPPRKWVTNWPN
jgi:prepilin-type N-terminal cleavage/methylation domain-containing protein